MSKYELRLPALQIRQGSRYIYCFAVEGKILHDFTTVSRVHRTEDAVLHGYQRPEVLSHIRAIRRYLESESPLLPNAIVLAFDSSVHFVPYKRRTVVEYSTPGDLIVHVDDSLSEKDKPALLVDGQQRSAAIRDAEIPSFPIAAVGFIAADADEQRSQFILVNNTKALPKGLIHELLPDTAGHLPPIYARRRLPASIMMRLNSDADSPFQQIISTPTAPNGYIKDNSVLRMIENSLYEGALYQYRDPISGEGDMQSMVLHLKFFWNVVMHRWPDAWKLAPRKSRLTHGVGIQALGYVMDNLTEGVTAMDLSGLGLEGRLNQLLPLTAWTSGNWQFDSSYERPWNSLQNTPNDVRLLTNYLIRGVKQSKRRVEGKHLF